MLKPKNFDNVSVGGDFIPVELGGHRMVIKTVGERQNRNGGDMIVVAFDFDGTDSQPDYFKKMFMDDVRPDKKWPINGTCYINVLDTRTNECSRNFKAFCTCVEDSNQGFKINWEAKDFGVQFKGLRIGGVFGAVENEYNGKVTKRHQLRWFTNYAKAKDAKIPNEKLLNNYAKNNQVQNTASSVPDDDDVPF